MSNKRVRVRFAPSPTGALHIGGVRTALFNYLFAKKHGGDFLLRIEDTDKDRFVVGAEKYIIDSLNWLGIIPNEGIKADGTALYRQSEREYKMYVDKLIETGHAYYAFDTKEELEALRELLIKSKVKNLGYSSHSRERMKNSLTLSADEVKTRLDSGAPYVIRFNTPKNKEIKFLDLIKGWVTFNSNDMDDKVLFKSDGLPTYHMANIVDDHLMEISHVIRGDEWLSSAPLHCLLYEALGWDRPEFCHLPLILGPDGTKLSKRHGDKYGFPVFPMTWDYKNEKGEEIHITGFKDEGYEPDALVNFLALLGWNPGDEKEIMSLENMVALFDFARVNNSGARFDIEKLKSFNAHYLRNRNSKDLFASLVASYSSKQMASMNSVIGEKLTTNKSAGGYLSHIFSINDNADEIVEIAKERSVFEKDLYGNVVYFFEPVVLKDDVILKNPQEFSDVMESFIDITTNKDNFIAEQIKYDLEEFCRILGFKIGKILPDLRMALTGNIPGPHLPEIMEILGKDESLKRIKNLLDKIKTSVTNS